MTLRIEIMMRSLDILLKSFFSLSPSPIFTFDLMLFATLAMKKEKAEVAIVAMKILSGKTK